MKDIFIMAHSMELGGAEKSLLGILENFDYQKYNVDLFLLRHQGELIDYIPQKVNVLPENKCYSSLGIPIMNVIRKGNFKIAYGRYIGKRKAIKRIQQLQITTDHNIINEYSHKYTVNYLPIISHKKYDLAISFMSPHYFIAKNVIAEKKVAWIHTDYSTFLVDVDSETDMWNQYDEIISISDAAKESFLRTFPVFEKKVKVIENIIPINYIKSLSDAFSVEHEMVNDGSIKLLSIGRFTFPKRFDEVPQMCKIIRDNGLNVKWYLIGFGGDEKLINSQIEKEHIKEYVINLGKKENPYPYIKACDFYIQPSRYEGKSIAVREAQIFSKPVVITDFSTAHSQLRDGVDGLIVPMNLVGASNGISEFIRNTSLQKQIVENTKKNDYVGKNEIKKLYALLE